MGINLNSGKYTAEVEYDDMKVNSTVTVKPTISGNNVTKIYRNDTQYYAAFTDTSGNLLKNADVNFNINGVFYTRKTMTEVLQNEHQFTSWGIHNHCYESCVYRTVWKSH